MSKTIKQISEELGVTKQAIHQRLKRNADLKNSLKPFMKTVDGVIHVEVGGQNLLKEAFIKPINKYDVTDNKSNVTDNKDNVTDNTLQPVITILEATIKTLQEQLSVKDKQIENLTTTLQDSQEHREILLKH